MEHGRGALSVRIVSIVLLCLGGCYLSYRYLSSVNIPVLNPKGTIALEQYHLLLFAVILSLVVVIPVFVMLFGFALRYREGSHGRYEPHHASSARVELIWWGVPALLILVLSIVTWTSTNELDPYRPLAPASQTITVDAVSLDWQWLFIYPDEHIALTNSLVIPAHEDISLHITSDGPMNGLWIPQLAGQIMAMPGMQTQLNIVATTPGTYEGLSSNISGVGFSSMTFPTKVIPEQDYSLWLKSTQHRASTALTMPSFIQLATPTIDHAVRYYSVPQANIFQQIIMNVMQGKGVPRVTA